MSRAPESWLPARFWRVLFWEFVQNLPLVSGFLWGLALWREGKWQLTLVVTVAGSVLGSLAIWATESKIIKGHRESWPVVGMNVLAITGLTIVLIAYLAASWSRWWTDLLAGAAGGIVLAVAQDVAAGNRIGLGHALAFALSFAAGLVGVRLLSGALPLLVSVLIVGLLVTAAIVLLDYGRPAGSHA